MVVNEWVVGWLNGRIDGQMNEWPKEISSTHLFIHPSNLLTHLEADPGGGPGQGWG